MALAGARPGSVLERWSSHPWLVGDPALPGRTVAKRVRTMTLVATLLANAVGVAVVTSFALLVLPKPDGVSSLVVPLNLAVGGAYTVIAIAIGIVWGRRLLEAGPNGIRAWLETGTEPTPAQRLRVLRAPLRIAFVQVVLWGVATAAFAVLNAPFSALLALGVGITVALGGLTTSAASYLLTELALRPVASRALSAGRIDRRFVPGVTSRWLLAWALGTGAPLVGLVLVGIVALTDVHIAEGTLALAVVVIGSIALIFGALLTLLAAYATVHPIASIRFGLERVRQGDFSAQVGVWDSTEMGLLQSGFNEMVEGLRERERIRDVFGRQVGQEAASRSLEIEEPELGGETCGVAVLFVDVVGSTALAASTPPQRVVELLNRFFAEVVDAVEGQGGWINKFEGDAALAIFGAPEPLPQMEAAALAAARDLCARLIDRVPEMPAAIGVASGSAVAGYVGAERRFEYTVIGDPVNEAARLTELAKSAPGRVLASASMAAAAGDEAQHWRLGETVTLRGRSEPTRLAHPM